MALGRGLLTMPQAARETCGPLLAAKLKEKMKLGRVGREGSLAAVAFSGQVGLPKQGRYRNLDESLAFWFLAFLTFAGNDLT